ncbi:MAG: hypothetical protein V7K32_14240 [Nostoc sp.]|uniref:hypothetical protein n=1 Tax=Nostoc sp. TaxID=1180 RepID=UPI002FFCC20C
MFRFRIHKKWVILAVLSCFFLTTSAFAISFRNTDTTSPVALSPDFDSTLSISKNNTDRFTYLTQIEKAFDTIESIKVVTLEQSEEISNATKKYADKTKADLDIALKNATLLAETEGKSGEIESLSTFETLEDSTVSRLENIQNRAAGLEKLVKAGSLILDQSLIKTLSTDERADFLGSLPAQVQNRYTESQPQLFKGVSPNVNPENLQSLPERFQNVNPSETLENQQSFLPKTNTTITAFNPVETLGNIILPPAYAVAAAPCVRFAIARDWTNLAICVVNAGSQATQIYNEFKNCWYSASGWLQSWKRAFCVGRLIIRIA